MKVWGMAILLAYGIVAFGGFEPFSSARKGPASTSARRGGGAGGFWMWTRGFQGGK